MTLQQFLDLKENDIELTVYDSAHNPILSWHDNDKRYGCPVTAFGIMNEFEMWVDIDTTILDRH